MEFEKGKNELDFTKPAEADSLKIRSFAIIDKDHIRHISAKPFLKIIKRSLHYLADEYEVKFIYVARFALHHGRKVLWMFGEDISQIRECKQRVHKTGNTDFLGDFENNHFDLGSSDFTKFNGRFNKEDLSGCEGLACGLGLSNSVIYQLAIAAGLLNVEKLTGNENEFYYCLLVRFKEWLQVRSRSALYMAELAEKNSQPQLEGPFRTLRDVFGHSDNK